MATNGKTLTAKPNGGTDAEDPQAEERRARDLAARYRCEFVDLRDHKIDHDLFHSIPVDLMFRYNFVPLQVARTARSRSPSPIRAISDLIDELAVLLDKKLRVQGRHALADHRSAQEDRAVAARARRGHRRLHARRRRRRGEPRRDALDRPADRATPTSRR